MARAKSTSKKPRASRPRPPRYGVPDEENPEWTAEDFARARPALEVLPGLIEAAARLRARGRPRLEKKLQQFSLRIEPDVLNTFKETGPGWQEHMRETLAKEAKRLSRQGTKPRSKKG
jgi:uncharacterized protein (DUF4415 family)